MLEGEESVIDSGAVRYWWVGERVANWHKGYRQVISVSWPWVCVHVWGGAWEREHWMVGDQSICVCLCVVIQFALNKLAPLLIRPATNSLQVISSQVISHVKVCVCVCLTLILKGNPTVSFANIKELKKRSFILCLSATGGKRRRPSSSLSLLSC